MPTVPITTLRSDIRRMARRTSDLKEEASIILEASTPEQWVWSPDKRTWNMALIIEHLNSVNRLGLPRIAECLARLRAEGHFSDDAPSYGFVERFFIRLLSPNPPFCVPVPSIYFPKAPANPTEETGKPFVEGLDRLLVSIQDANGLDLKRMKLRSPANALVRLTVGAWLESLVAHNDYHWMQVRILRDHDGFPRTRIALERSLK